MPRFTVVLLVAVALLSSVASYAGGKLTPAQIKALESLPGSNTTAGQVDPRAVITTAAPKLTPEKLQALETLPGSNTPYGQLYPGAAIGGKAVPGRMMTAVFPEAKAYAMQPQAFLDPSYAIPAPPMGQERTITPEIRWLIKNPKGQLVWGEWIVTLSASGDLKVVGDHFACEGGTGAMMVMVFNANNPHLCWVDTAWAKVGDPTKPSAIRRLPGDGY